MIPISFSIILNLSNKSLQPWIRSRYHASHIYMVVNVVDVRGANETAARDHDVESDVFMTGTRDRSGAVACPEVES